MKPRAVVHYEAPYTAAKLAELADTYPDKILIAEYKEHTSAGGFDRMRGELLTAYISLSGRECANVGNFARVVYCEDILGHYFV